MAPTPEPTPAPTTTPTLAPTPVPVLATCENYSCPSNKPLNKGSSKKCSGDAASCDTRTCCERKATCKSFSCNADNFVKIGFRCSAGAESCDANTCCTDECNWQCYIDRYPDLQDRLNQTTEAAKSHY